MKKQTIKSGRDKIIFIINRWGVILFLLTVFIFNSNFAVAQSPNPCYSCQPNIGATTESGYINPELDKKFPSPIIIPPDDTLVNPNMQQCRAVVALDTPGVAQPSFCPIPIKTITNNAPPYYSVGTTVVQWKFTNIYKKSTVVNQNVIVVNNLLANINSTNPACYGLNNGSSTIIPSGGTQPYSYLWSNGQTSQNANGLASGSYNVTVTDNNGCVASQSITLTEPPQLIVIATANSNVSTCGGSDGSASAQVSGGTNPVQILWSNNQSGPLAVNLQSGTYTAIATDLQGCSSSDTALITQGISEICNNNIDDNCNGFIDEGCSVTLNLKVLFEGFYLSNGIMNAVIDPLTYPNLCDTVTVELHNPTSPYQLAVNDKKTIDINGNGQFSFPASVFNQSYYIVIKHRNTLETWSSNTVLFNNPVTNYDFSVSANMAYGNNQSNLGDGKFAVWSGDISDALLGLGFQDGIVESSDYSDMESAVYYTLLGYKIEDLTGDGIVESSDYGLMETNLYYTIVSMHP